MENFLPDTDNFFKYLLTIGLILIVFVIIYPVQQQKEADIEINGFQKDAQILDYKVKRLTTDIDEFANTQSGAQHQLDSLKEVETSQKGEERGQTELLRAKIRDEFEAKRLRLIQLTDSLAVVNIINQAERKKIQRLEGYFTVFKTYKIVFLIIGFILAFIGFLYWTASVYRDEKKKDSELQGHQSTFVRHCKRFFEAGINKTWVWILIIILLIGGLGFVVWCSNYS